MEHSEAPLISIIVSCYNQESFIAEAFDGIFSQSYRPLEIVFVDDRSTDRTADILSSRLAEHPERFDMRLLRGEANIGTRGNLHRGIAATTGRLIAVTCGDDVLTPNAIAEIAGVWQDEDVSLITVNAEYIDDKSQPLGRTYREPDEPPDDSFETLARDGVNACCFGPFLCFERELFDRFGWPEELEVFDVIAPFYAYLLKGARFISRPLLKYRIHGGNTSHSLIAEGFGGIPRLLVEEQMRIHAMTHALHARDILSRSSVTEPERYAEIKERIWPLLEIQLSESIRKFIKVREELKRASKAR